MVNIFLTKKCNLKCPYCFASEFVNKENEEITISNFNKVLDFIKRDGTNTVGLLGGEPTIYSGFEEVLNILIADKKIENVVIFTNGLELHKYEKYWGNKKFRFLVNCNSPYDISHKQYENLKQNIKMLDKIAKHRFLLGINLYEMEMDYSFIFELLNSVNIHSLRFSISLPNDDKELTVDILEKVSRWKPLLIRFFTDCIKNEISPIYDCNSFPDCLFTVDDKRLLLKLAEIAKKFNIGSPLTSSRTCVPVVDILPDLTAIRCLGLSKQTRINLEDFKNITNIKKYYLNNIDLFARVSYCKQECDDCKIRLLEKCGVCFTFKLNQIQNMKNMALGKSSIGK